MVSLTQQGEKQLLVAFGANQNFGDIPPDALIMQAAQELGRHLSARVRLSRLFRTPCFPAGTGNDYVNAAAQLTLGQFLPPDDILHAVHAVESRFGRQRSTRWASRTLDIDLLAMGDMVLPNAGTQAHWRHMPLTKQATQTPERLILPHPRMQDRAFVLVPLAEVASDWRHPALGLSVAEMLAALAPEDRASVVPLGPAASI